MWCLAVAKHLAILFILRLKNVLVNYDNSEFKTRVVIVNQWEQMDIVAYLELKDVFLMTRSLCGN